MLYLYAPLLSPEGAVPVMSFHSKDTVSTYTEGPKSLSMNRLEGSCYCFSGFVSNIFSSQLKRDYHQAILLLSFSLNA